MHDDIDDRQAVQLRENTSLQLPHFSYHIYAWGVHYVTVK